MTKPRTNRAFESYARRRLGAWLKRRGYDAPEYEVEWCTSGAAGVRILRAAVRRGGEVVDVKDVEDSPGDELVESWARGER